MTRPSSVARRVALPISAALVGGTFAAVGLAAPAQAAGSQAVDQSFNYKCDVEVGGLMFEKQDVGVNTATTIPRSVYRGESIRRTPVTITLTMPELLRNASYTLLGARYADGSSTDAAVSLGSAGRSMTKTFSVAAAKTAIPKNVGDAWTIPAKGNVPAMVAPGFASGSVVVAMPKSFTIAARIYPAGDPINARMACSTTGALALGKPLTVVNAAPKAPKKVKVVTKKNKAKKFVIRATDADGNRLSFKAGKVKKKAGKVKVKGKKLTFKPRKNFKGKSSFVVKISDGKGGIARTKVNVVVR